MSQLRILDQNYAFDDGAVTTASSEDTAFPVSNLAKFSRSKVWRSPVGLGTFVIGASNNKIDFSDGGAPVVATLTSGTYNASTLAAEIKTRMDAAGSLVHTVTHSAVTGKWTISVPSGAFAIYWYSGANAASSVRPSIGFYSGSDSSGAPTYTGQFVAIHTEERITFDTLSFGSLADSFAVLFDPNTGTKFTESAVLKLQANPLNTFTAPALDVTLSLDTDQDVITHFFATSQTYRYWSLKIVDPTNSNLYVEIAKIVLSNSLQLSRMPRMGFRTALADLSKVVVNSYGHEFADVYPSQRMAEYGFTGLTQSDRAELWKIYNRLGKVTPLAVALDPLEVTLSNKDEHFIYGRLSNDFDATHQRGSLFEFVMSLKECL